MSSIETVRKDTKVKQNLLKTSDLVNKLQDLSLETQNNLVIGSNVIQ